jgi:hypothetical protein
MVHDHYSEDFAKKWPWIALPAEPTVDPVLQMKDAEIAALKQQIEDYKQALEAAKVVDILTKQPDCVDADKAKLLERINLLERVIDKLLCK